MLATRDRARRQAVRPHGQPGTPAHDTERRAIGPMARVANRRTKKDAHQPLGDGRFNN
ncbi:hypothetical protein C7S13_4549 [Burkholderia cepacia]|nr:hypothetical protein [Burkholderia cepacia]